MKTKHKICIKAFLYTLCLMLFMSVVNALTNTYTTGDILITSVVFFFGLEILYILEELSLK